MFQALYTAGSKRNINLKIAQNWPSKAYPNSDTEYLVKKKAAQVPNLTLMPIQALGCGIPHTNG